MLKSYIYYLADPRVSGTNHDLYNQMENMIGSNSICQVLSPNVHLHEAYIGKTYDLKKRLKSHISLKKKDQTYRANWIRKLVREGVSPVIVPILEIEMDFVPINERRKLLNALERYVIAVFTPYGFAEKNATPGGDGLDSESAKIHWARVNANITPEQRKERAKKALETLGPDGLRKRMKKMNDNLGVEGRKARSRKAVETQGAEVMAARLQKYHNELGHAGRSALAKKAVETLGTEGIAARLLKVNETLGISGRSARSLKAHATLGESGRKARSAKAQATLGVEGRSRRAKKQNENLGVEGRKARSRKAVETQGVDALAARLRKVDEALGEQGRSARAKKRAKNLGKEALKEISAKGRITMGPDGRQEAARKAMETMGAEGLSKRSLKVLETLGQTGLSDRAKKTNATRKANSGSNLPVGITIKKNRYVVRAGVPRKYLGQYVTLDKAISVITEYHKNPEATLYKRANTPRKYFQTQQRKSRKRIKTINTVIEGNSI